MSDPGDGQYEGNLFYDGNGLGVVIVDLTNPRRKATTIHWTWDQLEEEKTKAQLNADQLRAAERPVWEDLNESNPSRRLSGLGCSSGKRNPCLGCHQFQQQLDIELAQQ